jgi:predicted ester cyclase
VDNKELFRRYQDALRKPELLAEVLTADFVAHDLPPPAGREALIAFREVVNRATSQERLKIWALVAEGDRVAARMTVEATHTGELFGIAPTGKQLTFDIYEFVRVADGRIAERWVALSPGIAELVQQLRG